MTRSGDGKIVVAHMLNQFEDGGAERQLLELLKRIDRQRFRPLLYIGSAAGTITAELQALDIPVQIVGRRHGRKLGFLPLISELRRQQVDIVHSWMFVANVWARLAGKLARVPVIITSERGLDSDLPEYYRWVDVGLSPLSDCVVVNALAVAEHAHRNRFVPRSKIVNIYNGVDLDRYSNLPAQHTARSDLGIPYNAQVVGMVASFAPRKRWDVFLEALSKVVSQPPVLGVCVGDGALKGEMEKYAASLGLQDQVRFLGLRSDVPEIMASLDVFVLSSDDEGMPNVVMQAMAAARPVVATDAGGTRELVLDGHTGFVVPCGNAELLATRLRQLLEDPDLSQRFGHSGRERIENHFTFEAAVSRTVRLYEQLLERKAA